MATVTKPLALNESLNSTENTPRNIADVLADELDGIKQAINGQSGSGNGHIIQNSSGANMPSENTMQFVDAHLSDDSVGGKTKVETFKAVTEAEYSSETEDGAYIITDGDGATIGPASEDYVEVTADGVKTYEILMNELGVLIDKNKLNYQSVIYVGHNIYRIISIGDISFDGFYPLMTNNSPYFADYRFRIFYSGSGSQFRSFDMNGYTTYNSDIPTNGTKITLYYGQKKAVVDLQTTANRCLTSDGDTVQQKFNTSIINPTAGTDVTGGFWSRLSVTRQANLICCNLCPITINKTSGAIVATSMPKPLLVNNEQYVQFPLFSSGGASCGYGRLSLDGQMTFNTTGEINYVFCNFTYITTD